MLDKVKGYLNTKRKPDPRYKGGEAYAEAVEEANGKKSTTV